MTTLRASRRVKEKIGSWLSSPKSKTKESVLFLLFLLLPTQLGKHFWPGFSYIYGLRIDYLSPVIYLTDLLVVVLVLLNIKTILCFEWKRKWYISVFFLFLFVVGVFSYNPGAATFKLLKIIEMFLLFLIAMKTPNYKVIVRKAFPWTILYVSIIVILQFVQQSSIGGVFWWLGERSFSQSTPGIALADIGGRIFLRPYGVFSHPNSLAGFILISCILLLGVSKNYRKILLLLTLSFIVLLLVFSRAVWLTTVILLFVMTYRHFKKGNFSFKKRLLLFLTFLILLVISSFFVMSQNSESVSERVQVAIVSIKIFESFPLVGAGLNNFIGATLRLNENVGKIYWFQPVHNIYLLVLAETGIIGFSFFLWFIFLTVKRLFFLSSGLIWVLVPILILGLFDHYWITLQQNQLLFTLVLGFCWQENAKMK